MPLANKLKRLVLLIEPDIQRMLEKQAQRTHGHDDVRWDDRAGAVSFLRHGSLLWQPRAERIGEWSPELGLFRWWWSGIRFGEHGKSRLDAAYREGERYQMSELTTDPVTIESVDDAELLARLAAQLSRADGVLRLPYGDRIAFVALYEPKPGESTRPTDVDRLRDTSITRPSQRPAWMTSDALEQPTERPSHFTPAAVGAPRKPFSVAPAARTETQGRASTLGVRSIAPPVRALDLSPDDEAPAIPPPPRMPTAAAPVIASAPVREPSREVFLPVAQAAAADLAGGVAGFAQAILVVRVELDPAGKGRFFVQLVALDGAGELVALDPSRALLDATAKMVADDAREGNGRWRKLTARMRPSARGASVDLEVV